MNSPNDDPTASVPDFWQRLIAANKLVAVCVVGAILYVAHAAFVPIALALLCALILSGPVETLQRFGVPRPPS